MGWIWVILAVIGAIGLGSFSRIQTNGGIATRNAQIRRMGMGTSIVVLVIGIVALLWQIGGVIVNQDLRHIVSTLNWLQWILLAVFVITGIVWILSKRTNQIAGFIAAGAAVFFLLTWIWVSFGVAATVFFVLAAAAFVSLFWFARRGRLVIIGIMILGLILLAGTVWWMKPEYHTFLLLVFVVGLPIVISVWKGRQKGLIAFALALILTCVIAESLSVAFAGIQTREQTIGSLFNFRSENTGKVVDVKKSTTPTPQPPTTGINSGSSNNGQSTQPPTNTPDNFLPWGKNVGSDPNDGTKVYWYHLNKGDKFPDGKIIPDGQVVILRDQSKNWVKILQPRDSLPTDSFSQDMWLIMQDQLHESAVCGWYIGTAHKHISGCTPDPKLVTYGQAYETFGNTAHLKQISLYGYTGWEKSTNGTVTVQPGTQIVFQTTTTVGGHVLTTFVVDSHAGDTIPVHGPVYVIPASVTVFPAS